LSVSAKEYLFTSLHFYDHPATNTQLRLPSKDYPATMAELQLHS